jgi:hypothetical protein
MFNNLKYKTMTTVIPEELQTTPTSNSITNMDMVCWWTNNGDGNFDWMLYKQIIDAKRFLYSNHNDSSVKKVI